MASMGRVFTLLCEQLYRGYSNIATAIRKRVIRKQTALMQMVISLELQGEKTRKDWVRYRIGTFLLCLYQKFEKKNVKTKYFWVWGRFRLPPYWFRTKTYKCIALFMVFLTMFMGVFYYLGIHSTDKIQAELTRIMQGTDEERVKPVESNIEIFVDDRPKTVDGGLAIVEDGELVYNFLHKNLQNLTVQNVVGHICCNACNIDFTVVQTDNNEYYLNHDIYGRENRAGWIFLDYRCQGTEPLLNTVIYGHTLLAGGMFSNLSGLLEKTEPVYIQYQSKSYSYIYEVISVYTTEPSPDYIRQNFSSDELKSFFETITAKNEWAYAPHVALTAKDSILTLSTCVNDGANHRLAVHCRLVASEAYVSE